MSDILPTYMYNAHLHTHTQFHTNRLTVGTYYTHTSAYIYTECHAPSHSRIVASVQNITHHFSSLAQWGAEVVQHLVAVLWWGSCCFGWEDEFGSSPDEETNVSGCTLMCGYQHHMTCAYN